MKTLIGLAFGTLSLGTIASASAAAPELIAPAPPPDSAIEVVVVTAERQSAQTLETPRRNDTVIASAPRAVKMKVDRAPPAMPIDLPKLEITLPAAPMVRF